MYNLVRLSHSSHPCPQCNHMFIRSCCCVFVVAGANGMPPMSRYQVNGICQSTCIKPFCQCNLPTGRIQTRKHINNGNIEQQYSKITAWNHTWLPNDCRKTTQVDSSTLQSSEFKRRCCCCCRCCCVMWCYVGLWWAVLCCYCCCVDVVWTTMNCL